MRITGSKKQKRTTRAEKRKRIENERQRRKRITEVMLAERLGLLDNWVERWEENGRSREESFAPEKLPQFIAAKLEREAMEHADPKTERAIKAAFKEYMNSVETDVGRLVAAGCRRRVVYFCLEELSPESTAIREGRRRLSVARSDGEYDLLPQREKDRPTINRDDMKTMKSAVIRARHHIQRNRRGILWSAEATGRPLPRGLMTTPADDTDALAFLLDALTWASNLAQDYVAPFETSHVKGKGLLHLTAYIGLVIDAHKMDELAQADLHSTLAGLVNLVIGTSERQWAPSDLRDKLEKFGQDYPRLHELLAHKLCELHRFHAEH
jgi:hypothetical protein